MKKATYYLILTLVLAPFLSGFMPYRSITGSNGEVNLLLYSITQPMDTVPVGWVDLIQLDSTIELDLRYAGKNNFLDKPMYSCGVCYLREEAAVALIKVQNKLRSTGLGLKIFDCYRPLSVQEELWRAFPDPSYVTPPQKGSMHNRGLAVDVTLINTEKDTLAMGTAFDYFGREAHHDYTGFPHSIQENRSFLKEIMASEGFGSIRTEWWHYSYRLKSYPLSNFIWPCP
jgi:D-alanyl-D-alanine dipeptidase